MIFTVAGDQVSVIDVCSVTPEMSQKWGGKEWNNINLVYQLQDLNFGKILAYIVRNRPKGIRFVCLEKEERL